MNVSVKMVELRATLLDADCAPIGVATVVAAQGEGVGVFLVEPLVFRDVKAWAHAVRYELYDFEGSVVVSFDHPVSLVGSDTLSIEQPTGAPLIAFEFDG